MADEKDKENIQERIKRYLSPERQERLDFFSISVYLPLEPHHHVADIGCGPGFFSIPLAKHLIYGKLYALDTEEEMLEALRQRVKEERLGNVEVLLSKEAEFPLDKGSLDGVFLAFVVHHNQDRVAFLRACAELLKPRGWCTVLERSRKETEEGQQVENCIAPDELRELASQVGLEFRWWRDLGGEQYMALLRKKIDA